MDCKKNQTEGSGKKSGESSRWPGSLGDQAGGQAGTWAGQVDCR